MRRKHCSSRDERLVKRLVAAGRPMPAGVDQELPRDVILEVTRSDVTVAYDLRAGAEFVFAIRIKNESYTPRVLQVFQCRLPWDADVIFLGDPRIYTPECETYRLPSGRKFPYDDVINWRLGEKGVLQPGGSIEGLLLAYTMFTGVSPEYLHGDTAIADLLLIDQYWEHCFELEVRIDRRATMRPFVPRPGKGLYDGTETRFAPKLKLDDSQEIANEQGSKGGLNSGDFNDPARNARVGREEPSATPGQAR
jgi:hypothetical protein